MNSYQAQASESSLVYDFRKDFSAIAAPGMRRYMRACGYEPDAPSTEIDDCWEYGKNYVSGLFRGLRRVQNDFREFGRSADADIYDVSQWSREGAQSYIDQRLEDILTSYPAEDRPVDVHRAMYLGAQLARKHAFHTVEDGETVERRLDVSEEALAYAEARLKSKIRRDAVYNPITTVHDGIRSYNYLKPLRVSMRKEILEAILKEPLKEKRKEMLKAKRKRIGKAAFGQKVVYIDHYLRKPEAETEAETEAPEAEANVEAPKPSADRELHDLLPVVSGAALLEKNLPAPAFLVPNMFQRRKANLLMGEDGAGKSFLMLQLAVAVASGTKWLGMEVESGPAVFYTAEEEDRDLDARLRAVCAHMGVSAAQLQDLHLIPMGGALSSVLGEPGDDRKIRGTKLWRSLISRIEAIKPALVIIDPLNEVFDGDELKRVQARQFVGLMRPVAAEHDLAIIVTGHPSQMGVHTGSGTSGSTGWSAVFRSRTYLKKIKDKDDVTDTGDRELLTMKLSGADRSEPIALSTGRGGVLVRGADHVEFNIGGPDIVISDDDKAFLEKMRKHITPFQQLSLRPKSFDYAAKVLGKRKGIEHPPTVKKNAASLSRLQYVGAVRERNDGPPSKPLWHIEIVDNHPIMQ
jgi:hypothetical protein